MSRKRLDHIKRNPERKQKPKLYRLFAECKTGSLMEVLVKGNGAIVSISHRDRMEDEP